MPTIKELRNITQSVKIKNRERPWLYKSFQRGPSIYITKLLIKTPVTPNMVSLAVIIVGVVGAYLIFLPGFYFKLLGLLFFYLNILLDKVDGELARFKKIFSLRGIYLDEINHLVIPALFFASLTISLSASSVVPDTLFLTLGSLAALSMPFIRVGHSLAPQMYAKKYMKNVDLFTLPVPGAKTNIEKSKEKFNLVRRILYLIHQFHDFFIIIFMFFVVLLLSEFVLDISILPHFIILYGILLPIIFIENSIKGVLQIEQRVSDISNRFRKDQ